MRTKIATITRAWLPAVTDESLNITLSGNPSALPLIRSRKLRAMAVAGNEHLPILADAAYFAATGVPDFYSPRYFALVVPAAT